MNGDHRELYEKINSLEIKIAEIKKDTEYIRNEIKNQVRMCEHNVDGFNRRITANESWRYKMVGAASAVSAITASGAFIFLKLAFGI